MVHGIAVFVAQQMGQLERFDFHFLHQAHVRGAGRQLADVGEVGQKQSLMKAKRRRSTAMRTQAKEKYASRLARSRRPRPAWRWMAHSSRAAANAAIDCTWAAK